VADHHQHCDKRHPVLEAVVGDVADLEAANTYRLSRPPHLRGVTQSQVNIVGRERSEPR